MTRHVHQALLLLAAMVGTAFAVHTVSPPHYPQPPGGATYEYGDTHAVRSVYEQPLVPPVASDEHFWDGGGEVVDGELIGEECASCDAAAPCSPRDWLRPFDMWARGEYLFWWSKGSRPPPLVTTSTGTGRGILDEPDTQVLFGSELIHRDERDGGRFSIGAWLNDDHCHAIEVDFFFLEDASTGFEAQSTGTPLLGRPFFNVELQTEAVQTIASEGVSTGGVFISSESKLNGAEVLLRRRMDYGCDRRVDFLYGYRYAGLDERLVIRDELTSIDPTSNVPLGTVVGGFDSFQTFNQFHGGELGLSMDFYRRRWALGLVGKIAFGNMREQVTVGGTTFVAVPGAERVDSVGGLLTQASNIGGFKRDQFAVIPEGQLNVRYCWSPNVELSAGYTFIFISEAVRPADQIDRRVDPRQITDPANATPLPAFDFLGSEFWVQGVNVGFEYKF
jgi:Putative beta barrel porin-7 (BBP7)